MCTLVVKKGRKKKKESLDYVYYCRKNVYALIRGP